MLGWVPLRHVLKGDSWLVSVWLQPTRQGGSLFPKRVAVCVCVYTMYPRTYASRTCVRSLA